MVQIQQNKLKGPPVLYVNFDLSFTGKEFIEGGLPKTVEPNADWDEKLVVLNGFHGKAG